MTDDWLADVVIVNESPDETAGDISIFRSAGEACRYLEDWWVREHLGSVFTAQGRRLVLGINGSNLVFVVEQHETARGPEIILNWLRVSATNLQETRRRKSGKGKAVLSAFEQQRRLPTTVEGLIAYLGFTE